MEKDIKSIIVLLATQAMINMGAITDPLSGQAKSDLPGAAAFIELLKVLENKTRGNLTPEEAAFLGNVQTNLDKVYHKKRTAG